MATEKSKKTKSHSVGVIFSNPKTFLDRLKAKDQALIDALSMVAMSNPKVLAQFLADDLLVINEQSFGKVTKAMCRFGGSEEAARALQVLVRGVLMKINEN